MAQDLSPFDANALADKLQGADPETVNGAIYQLSQKGYNVPQQVSALMNQSTQQSQVANATPQDGNSLNLFNYQSSGNDLLDAAKAFGEGAVNAIPSTIGVVGNVAKAAINVFNPNPQQNTAVNIGKLALGAVASVPGTFNQQMQNTLPQGVQDFLSDSKGTFNNMLQYYANRYGGYQNVLKSIANDPAGVALDLSVVLDGVGGALDAAKIGTAAQDSAIADAVSAGGEGVDYGNVAKAAGNVSMPGGIPETIGGQISKVGEAINPITLPFRAAGKLVGANAAAPGAVETAATNQGIEGSLTSGMKAGGMQRVLEGIASYLPASKQIIARINTAFDATTKAMTDFGSKMTDAFAGGNETPEEIIGNVSSKVQETANANLDLAKNMFGQFAAKNGEIEVDATKPFAPTSASAAIDGSGAISPAGVAQYVSDPNNAISYTSKINNFFKSVNKILNPQAEEAVTPESIAARELGMAGAKATPSLISQYIANNGDIIEKEMGEGGSTTPTVRTLYNISNGIDNLFQGASPRDQVPLAALRDSIHSAIGDALKTSEPGLFDQWSALKDQYSTASQAMEQEAYKSLTTATDPAKFLNKFFGKGATLERIYSLKNVVGQDNFQELGRAFLVQNILPAFKEVTESGADDLSTQQTIFNSLQFQKNIASISDAKWQQILDPQTYLRLNAFKADAADFETIVKKGLGGAKQFSEGSKTTPMYRALRYVSPVTTGAGLAVVGGLSLATGGIITGLTLLLGDAGLARFVGSDIGQSILGSNSIMSRAANGLSHLAPPGTGVAAGIAQQAAAANNASTEQQAGKLKQLTPAQLQGLQTQSQTMDPKGLAGARSQLAKLGYQIPDFLFQTNGSTTTQAGQ